MISFFFTKREYQTLTLFLEGKDSKSIAHILDVSSSTIEAFKRSLRVKLGCRTDYGIPAAIIAEFGLDFYMRFFERKIGKSMAVAQLTKKEVAIIQYLIYDFKMIDLQCIESLINSRSNQSVPKILRKAKVESYPELVAILLYYNRVKVPLRINLSLSA